MKFRILFTLITTLTGLAQSSLGQDHTHHAKHNMVLFGDSNIYASHIVYKVPHNYQVILQVQLDPATLRQYSEAKEKNPTNQFILLLDSMNISEIREAKSISGTILVEDIAGGRVPIVTNVVISKDQFQVIYFDEVPLSLSADAKPKLSEAPALRKASSLQCAKDDQRPECCLSISNCFL